jgi:catechol 2,3-dioxygenase-like lactoylglutathione lyase family enzyme
MERPYSLAVVRVFVRDFERALAFYTETLGMPLAHGSDGWAQLDTGAAQLALERVGPGEADGEALLGRFVGVSLAVADVDAVHARLRSRGVEFLGPPERMPWGGTLAHFRDPEGNVLTLLGAGAPA